MLCGVLFLGGLLAQGVRAGDDKGKKEEKAAVAAEKKEAKAEAKEAKEGEKEAPEIINYEKAKMGKVAFPHKKHSDMVGGCATCHEGEKPIFKQEKSELKMADMYKGESCGACHDGKKAFKKDGKDVATFAAKGGCMKCHKK
ncbi:MAG: hypothetical protein HY928_07105 [Elusimicrobia bacterium]|nr:hypothetical protein [Elusimicrobiota bacterium]